MMVSIKIKTATFIQSYILYMLKSIILGPLIAVLFICTLIQSVAQGLDVKPQTEKFTPNYQIYHNLSSIQNEIIRIASQNPNYIKLDKQYVSRHGRSQLTIHVTNFTGHGKSSAQAFENEDIQKVKILFVFGEHAREFLPVESMLHLLRKLTSGLKAKPGSASEQFSRTVLSKVDLYIIGMANPDGRDYVENKKNYCWRGTSTGVDLQRNFDWEYGGKGSSGNPQDEEYRGTKVFSEPESKVYRELTSQYQFDAFFSFHSGIKQIYVPYADSISKKINRRPNNIEDMLDLASELSHATKFEYKYGLSHKLNDYSADGTAFDYMAGVQNIPFSFTIELWGIQHSGPSCFDLFNPLNGKLQSIVEDLHPLYAKIFFYLIEWKSSQGQAVLMTAEDAPSLTLGYVLVCAVIILTIIVAIQGKFCRGYVFQPRRRIVSLKALGSTFSMSFSKSG